MSDLSDASVRSRLAAYIATAAGAREVAIVALERMSGGAVQENWALDVQVSGGAYDGARRWVLRTDAAARVGESLKRSEEFQVLQAAHAAGLHAPQPLWLCDDPAVTGREFFIMQRLPGIASGHRITREAALIPYPARLARELAENLAHLHAISPRRELGFLPTMLARDSIAHYRQYLDQLDEPHPALEWGLRWCELNAPAAEETTLIHRDYRTGNYLVDGGRLAGVLDWEFAAFGNPLEDVGWIFAKCWRFAGKRLPCGGIAGADDFLVPYQRASGRTVTPAALVYWQVMAHIRWSVIALQQAQRHLSGVEPSLELALTGRIVAELEHEIVALTKTPAEVSNPMNARHPERSELAPQAGSSPPLSSLLSLRLSRRTHERPSRRRRAARYRAPHAARRDSAAAAAGAALQRADDRQRDGDRRTRARRERRRRSRARRAAATVGRSAEPLPATALHAALTNLQSAPCGRDPRGTLRRRRTRSSARASRENRRC
jgi:aminoglycoside phosphotransferase (APT) family kinase protein